MNRPKVTTESIQENLKKLEASKQEGAKIREAINNSTKGAVLNLARATRGNSSKVKYDSKKINTVYGASLDITAQRFKESVKRFSEKQK